MGAKRSIFAAFVIAVILGVGGGFGVRALADGMIAPPIEQPETRPNDPPLRILEARGETFVLSRAGEWRPARDDDAIERPSGVRTSEEGSVRIGSGPAVIEASRGARVLVNGPKATLRLFLEGGRLTVHSPEENIEVVMGDLEVAGRSFGVWSLGNKSVVAAIGKEVTIKRDGQQQRFTAGNEIAIGGDVLEPSSIPPELRVELEKVERRGNRFHAEGRTSKHAVLVLTSGGERVEVPVGPEGRFVTTISQLIPAPRELVAYDAAGREAEVGHPSPSLEAFASREGKNKERRVKVEEAAPRRPAKVEDEYDSTPRKREPDPPPAKVVEQEERRPVAEKTRERDRDREEKPERKAKEKSRGKDKSKGGDDDDEITLDLDLPTSAEKPRDEGSKKPATPPAPEKEEKAAPQPDPSSEDPDEVKLEWD